MSQLSEAIAAAGPQAVARAIASDPAWRVFNLLWTTPDEIAPTCKAMGFETVADVAGWVQRVSAAMGETAATFERLIDPPLDINPALLPSVPFPVIHQAIVDQCQRRDDFFIEQSDAAYKLPTRQQWEQLAQAFPMRGRKWVADSGDCDDFVKAFAGWLSMRGLGNLAVAFCAINPVNAAGDVIGGHAVALVMDADRKLWFCEPQDGKLYPPNYARLGGYFMAAGVKLARCFF
jgi:hypothetical protein